MEKANLAEERIESLFDLHRYIISVFFKDFEEVFKLPEGLNFTHMKAMLTLRFHGKMTMSDLSRMLVIAKGSFTPVAARLITGGYIEKEQSAGDKRVYNLVLTEAGMELTTRFKNEHWAYMTEILDRLPPDEQGDYFAHVTKLNAYHKMIESRT